MASRRPSSTRTRIETRNAWCTNRAPTAVDVRHPQEQGLKPMYKATKSSRVAIVDVRHPQEQGLKRLWRDYQVVDHRVDVRHPQEQGLKPRIQGNLGLTKSCRRPSSTRTRIETRRAKAESTQDRRRRRPSSTRTRIETLKGKAEESRRPMVDVRHPQEQGLKHASGNAYFPVTYAVDVRHPQEQGLKPSSRGRFESRLWQSTSVIHKNKD